MLGVDMGSNVIEFKKKLSVNLIEKHKRLRNEIEDKIAANIKLENRKIFNELLESFLRKLKIRKNSKKHLIFLMSILAYEESYLLKTMSNYLTIEEDIKYFYKMLRGEVVHTNNRLERLRIFKKKSTEEVVDRLSKSKNGIKNKILEYEIDEDTLLKMDEVLRILKIRKYSKKHLKLLKYLFSIDKKDWSIIMDDLIFIDDRDRNEK